MMIQKQQAVVSTPLTSEPLVTIAIPTFNRKQLAARAIRSALRQTYQNIEVIVSDNASDDGTIEHLTQITDHRLSLVRQPKQLGMVGNWNACLHLAHGRFFLLLSDDDELLPNAIHDLVLCFTSGPPAIVQPEREIAFAYGQCSIRNVNGRQFRRSPRGPKTEATGKYWLKFFQNKRLSSPSATLFERKDMLTVGGYHNNFGLATDVGMALSIGLLYPRIACTRTITTNYFVHDSNLTLTLTPSAIQSAWEELLGTLASSKTFNEFELKKIRALVKRRTFEASFHLAIRQHFLGKLSFKELMRSIWDNREKCLSLPGAAALATGGAKLMLHHFFGWRRPVKTEPTARSD